MKRILEIILGIVLAALLVYGYFGLYLTETKGRVYNCSIAEISPDIPLEVKEACRKQRMEIIK